MHRSRAGVLVVLDAPACFLSTSTSRSRTGSPSALATSAIRTAWSRSTSGYTTGPRQNSPAGRFCFGTRSTSMAIYLLISI